MMKVMKIVSFKLSIVFRMLVEVSRITPNLTSEGRLSWISGQSLVNLFGDIHRVGSRLLLDNDHTAFLAVIVSLLGTLFDAVLDAGNVAEVNGLVILMADHKIVHLVRIRKLTLYAERIGIRTDIHATARRVPVLLCDDGRDSFD